jgi:hypothetical protein
VVLVGSVIIVFYSIGKVDMPNWCNNYVVLKHADTEMLKQARDAFNRSEFCNAFVPIPDELKQTAAQHGTNEQENLNFAKFGYHSWYDFCVNEWGTKWDLNNEAVEAKIENGELILSFDSAWSPPTKIYEVLNDLGFEVKAFYYESGMCFAGIWEDGFDDYYEYNDMSASEVELTFPAELNEMFSISEQMAEWEEENEEENDE